MIGFDDVKNIASILKEAGKIEEYSKILELQQQLLEMQNQISILYKENQELREKDKTKSKLTFKNNAYYSEEDGPFCSRCWDKNRDLIRIIPRGGQNNYADCPECKVCVNYTGKDGNYGNKRAITMRSL